MCQLLDICDIIYLILSNIHNYFVSLINQNESYTKEELDLSCKVLYFQCLEEVLELINFEIKAIICNKNTN